MYNYLNGYIMNPIVLIIIILVVVSYYTFSASLVTDNLGNTSSGNSFGIIILIVLVLLVVFNAFQYFFSINVTAYSQGLFTPKTTVDLVVDQSTYQPAPVPEIKFKKYRRLVIERSVIKIKK